MLEKFSFEKKEMISSREKIINSLKKEGLIINDGYDYESEFIPDILPTLFHGTSQYFENDIKEKGLNPLTENAQLKKIFSIIPDLEILYDRAVKDGALIERVNLEGDSQETRKRVYTTYNFNYARLYSGSEIIEDCLNEFKTRYENFMPSKNEIIKKIGEINNKEKKILMSVLSPRPLVLSIKAPLELLDIKETNANSGNDTIVRFVSDLESRKQLRNNIEKSLKIYRQYIKEINTPGFSKNISYEDYGFMWKYLQDAVEKVGENEIFLLTIGELIEIFLRSRKGELLFKKIPSKFIKIENIHNESNS